MARIPPYTIQVGVPLKLMDDKSGTREMTAFRLVPQDKSADAEVGWSSVQQAEEYPPLVRALPTLPPIQEHVPTPVASDANKILSTEDVTRLMQAKAEKNRQTGKPWHSGLYDPTPRVWPKTWYSEVARGGHTSLVEGTLVPRDL